jgi:hypothetical protein
VGGNGPDGAPDPALGGLLSRLARSMGPGGVELGGENVRFEQAPEDGLEVRITLLDDDGEATSVASMLLPADAPPPAQPADVPFVRHAPLRVIEDHVRGVLLAMWMLGDEGAPDPEAALAAVVRGSREAGWRLEVADESAHSPGAGGAGPSGAADPPAGTAFRLLRGDQVRRVEARSGPTGPVVSLSQRRDVGDAELP